MTFLAAFASKHTRDKAGRKKVPSASSIVCMFLTKSGKKGSWSFLFVINLALQMGFWAMWHHVKVLNQLGSFS